MDSIDIADRATLRGYVAMQITCQVTGVVLDVARTVAAEIHLMSGNVKLVVVTADHWDAASAPQLDAVRAHRFVDYVKVLDGRDLFGRKKAGKALSEK